MEDKGESSSSQSTEIDSVTVIKAKRKPLRARITRTINRIKELVIKGDQSERRFDKELEQLRRDYNAACDLHGQLYEHADESQTPSMDKWENDLANDVFSLEEEVENYLATLKPNRRTNSVHEESQADHVAINPPTNNESGASDPSIINQPNQADHAANPPTNSEGCSPEPLIVNQPNQNTEQTSSMPLTLPTPPSQLPVRSTVKPALSAGQATPRPFDVWIDDLVEFEETVVNKSTESISIADALFKLEASKDIPSVKLLEFDGSALSYTDFIERFKIHIHDKPHLADDMRMIQLKMHVTGEAERAIAGLGSKGIMYATALKSLKEQFGQPSLLARALVDKLTKGDKIPRNNRQALREFSLDLINCLATMKQLNYFSDVNANDSLRRIIMRLPDHLIDKWKGVVTDIRERGHVPTIQHISDFVRKRVKAEFDPDFGDLQRERGSRIESVANRRGVHSTQRIPPTRSTYTLKCHVCEGNHKVSECPTFIDSSVEERWQTAKASRMCFSCLNKGHQTKDCRSKKKCDKNGCLRFHHPILHVDPPSASGVASVLDQNGILPVVRVRFRAENGRVREGNVLIDSGAGTTVIRTDFAKALGLQGKRERIDLAVVGGERIRQPESRRVNFWISSLQGSEEFRIQAQSPRN